MKLTLTEEKFEFDFPVAKALYKFDERDALSPTFHGVSMQAVDVMAEFPNFQLWIEIKEFQPTEIEAMKKEGDQYKKALFHFMTDIKIGLIFSQILYCHET